MLSRNNFNEKLRQMDDQRDHFSIRKLTIGAASVLIGITFMGFGGQTVHADEITQPATTQVETNKSADTQSSTDSSEQKASDTTQAAEVSQSNSQVNNDKNTQQVETEKANTESETQKPATSVDQTDKANEEKPADNQTQEKQEQQVPAANNGATDTTKQEQTDQNKTEQATDQNTQDLVVKKDEGTSSKPADETVENKQNAADQNAEEKQAQDKTLSDEKIQVKKTNLEEGIDPQSEDVLYNVADWDGTLDSTTHEYTLTGYHGTDKQHIYIPNTQDFINANRISSDDKVYITWNLMVGIKGGGATDITIDGQGEHNKVYAKDTLPGMLANSSNLKTVDLSHLDVSQVTSFEKFFQNDPNLEKVNISGWDMSNVTNSNQMFDGTNNLRDFDFSNVKNYTADVLKGYINASVNTNNGKVSFKNIDLPDSITSLQGLFYNNPYVKEIDMSGFNLNKVTNLRDLFAGASNVTSINLSGVNFGNINYAPNMFGGANSLTNINLTGAKNVNYYMLESCVNAARRGNASSISFKNIGLSSDVNSLSGLLSNMPSLESVDLTGFDINNVTDMSSMFSGDTNLENVNLSDMNFDHVTKTADMFKDANKLKNVNLTGTQNITKEILNAYLKGLNNSGVTDVSLRGISLSPNITSLSGLFKDMPNIKSVDLSGLDLSRITDMSSMFSGDTGLESVNLSGLNFGNVTNTADMFKGANNLKNVNLTGTQNITKEILNAYLRGLNNSGVTDVNLNGISLSSRVNDLSGLFKDMSNIKSVDLSGLEPYMNQIEDMSSMFSGDTGLESVNLSGLDFGHVTKTTDMFSGANNLKNVNLTDAKNITRDILDGYVKALKNSKATDVSLSGVSLSPNVTSLSGLFSNMPDLKNVDLSGLDMSHITDMNSMFSGDDGLENVDLHGLDFGQVTTKSMFSGANNLKNVNITNTKNVTKEILNAYIRGLDNSGVTDVSLSGIDLSPTVTSLRDLFYNMPNIKSVDLSGLAPYMNQIEDMSSMFSGDTSLESVNLSGLDFGHVTNVIDIFSGADNLKNVNINNTKNVSRQLLNAYAGVLKDSHATAIDLENVSLAPDVTDLTHVFENIPDLKTVKFTNVDTSHVTDMDFMFASDPNLESVDLRGLDTRNVIYMPDMFYNDPNLKSVNMSGLDLSKAIKTMAMFYGDNNLTDLDFSNTKFAPNVSEENGMFAYADGKIQNVKLTGATNIGKAVLGEYLSAARNTHARSLDLSNTSLAPGFTDFSNLFANLPDVESINLTGWTTDNVTNMSHMFYNDSSLKTITGIENWNTRNVTDMSYMFASLYSHTTNNEQPKDTDGTGQLESLNLTGWNTDNVTNMSYMFGGQTHLTAVGDLSNWNTDNVTNMTGLFFRLESLPKNSLHLANWNTGNVTDMSYMFYDMPLQEDLSFVNGWHTGNVTDMSYMFASDRALKSLDLSGWDVGKVGTKKDAYGNPDAQNYSLAMMFQADTALTSVGDISHWNTENVHDTRQMFGNTTSLTNIDLSGWNTSNLQIAEGMFTGSGAKHINLDNWDLSHIKRLNDYGFVKEDGKLRGVENMFKNLTNKSVISMNGVVLPDANSAFEINDFEGTNPIVVIANGKDGAALNDLLAVNNQTWTDGAGNTVTGRQNSDFITYVRADDPTQQIGRHGLNFIFTNLSDLHNYFNEVTGENAVKADMANDPNGKQLVHDWNAQHDVDGSHIVMTTRRVNPASSYDPYGLPVQAEQDGYILADLMTSKYKLDIVAPTTTTETKDPTRTIIIDNPDGSTRTVSQDVEFTRTVTKHVDGTEEATDWTPTSGNWDHFDVPQLDGYDSYVDGVAGTSIGAESVNADTANVTVHVTYKSNAPETPDNSEPDKPTPDNPTPDNPEPDKPKPETPEVPETPDEPSKPEKPTVPKDNDHNKSDESENIHPKAEDKNKGKKSGKTQNAGVHGQTAPHAATAPNRLVAPKNDELPNDKGLKELSSKPASAAKANANKKETLPQTGEEKNELGLIGLALLALTALGFVDRKRRN